MLFISQSLIFKKIRWKLAILNILGQILNSKTYIVMPWQILEYRWMLYWDKNKIPSIYLNSLEDSLEDICKDLILHKSTNWWILAL